MLCKNLSIDLGYLKALKLWDWLSVRSVELDILLLRVLTFFSKARISFMNRRGQRFGFGSRTWPEGLGCLHA